MWNTFSDSWVVETMKQKNNAPDSAPYLILCIILMVGAFIVPSNAYTDTYLEGYPFMQEHNLIASFNYTDYYKEFNIYNTVGNSVGNTIYLNGLAQSDFDDVRFTNSDNYLYAYEKISSNLMKVRIPSLTTGNNIIRVYYGNSTASSYSSQKNTYLMFDHFNETGLNTTIWNYAGSPSISSSQLVLYNPGSGTEQITTNTGYGINTSVTFYANIGLTSGNPYFGYYDTTTGNLGLFRLSASPTYLEAWQRLTGSISQTSVLTTNGTYKFQIIRNGTTSIKYYINDVLKAELSTNVFTSSGKIRLLVDINTLDPYSYDYVFVENLFYYTPVDDYWNPQQSYFDVDFSGSPTTGNNPLTVWFTDESIGTLNINSRQWNFGDGSINSTQQNPSHTYHTSGIYDVILTVFNTTYGTYKTEKKTSYINVGSGTPTPTPTPTTATPTPTYTPVIPMGDIWVNSYGSNYIIWQYDINVTSIILDGIKIPVYGETFGQYNLSAKSTHVGCVEGGICVKVTTLADGWYVFNYWLVVIILLALIVISSRIPISAIPTIIYVLYLIRVYLPSINAEFNMYIVVAILLIIGILVAGWKVFRQ